MPTPRHIPAYPPDCRKGAPPAARYRNHCGSTPRKRKTQVAPPLPGTSRRFSIHSEPSPGCGRRTATSISSCADCPVPRTVHSGPSAPPPPSRPPAGNTAPARMPPAAPGPHCPPECRPRLRQTNARRPPDGRPWEPQSPGHRKTARIHGAEPLPDKYGRACAGRKNVLQAAGPRKKDVRGFCVFHTRGRKRERKTCSTFRRTPAMRPGFPPSRGRNLHPRPVPYREPGGKAFPPGQCPSPRIPVQRNGQGGKGNKAASPVHGVQNGLPLGGFHPSSAKRIFQGVGISHDE